MVSMRGDCVDGYCSSHIEACASRTEPRMKVTADVHVERVLYRLGAAAGGPWPEISRSDLGKWLGDEFRRIWPSGASAPFSGSTIDRKLARPRPNLGRFSTVPEKRETGWWNTEDLNHPPRCAHGGFPARVSGRRAAEIILTLRRGA
jgi:hypothetical protein